MIKSHITRVDISTIVNQRLGPSSVRKGIIVFPGNFNDIHKIDLNISATTDGWRMGSGNLPPFFISEKMGDLSKRLLLGRTTAITVQHFLVELF